MRNNSGKNVWSEMLRGAKASIPIVLGFIPVGIAYAIMASEAGFKPSEAVFMSAFVFAGASEMMAVGMYKQQATVLMIALATFMMNLRHVIMSTCVFEKTERVGVFKRLFLGFFVTDESFAVTTSEKGKCSFPFFATLGVVHYLAWLVGTAIGAYTAFLIPKAISVSLGISLYAMFIGLIVPGIKRNLPLLVLVCGTAVLNTVLSAFIDSSYSLIVSTLVGAFVGVFFVPLDSDKVENTDSSECKTEEGV